MPTGRKPTAAMPAPPSFGYRCWQCPLGRDLQPRFISGYATPGDAMRGFERHQLFEHPSGNGLDWSSVGGR